MATSAEQNAPFIKQLASSDRRTRDKALDNLRTFLRHRKQFEELELLKLWRGLFFCMWMSDRPRTQQQLARDLAGLVDILSEETAIPFLDAFWKTMAREWMGIDVLRMDKFLYLVREYLQASFRHFSRIGWKDTERIDEYMEVLSKTPLNARNNKIPNGMRYHVLDIYVDELDKVDEKREGKIPLEILLKPLRALGRDSFTKSVRERVKEALEDERLKDWNGDGIGLDKDSQDVLGSVDDDEAEEWGGIED